MFHKLLSIKECFPLALKIFCPVWGNKHIELLDKALCTSLSWSKNKPYIENADWLVTSDSYESIKKIDSVIVKHFPKRSFQSFVYPEISKPGTDSGMLLIKSVQAAVDICLKANSPMLMATPDFIYGNGTIETFFKIANESGSCATIANVRVLPSILKVLASGESYSGSNADLIKDAFQCLHASWKQSPNNLFRGGVKVMDLGHGRWAVQHFIPSPFFVNFIDDDKNYFKEWHEGKPPGFGYWDHVWTTHLLDNGRIRFIGSSDAACMIEVTDEDKNVPPLNAAGDPPNKFFRNHFHNRILHQFVTTFIA